MDRKNRRLVDFVPITSDENGAFIIIIIIQFSSYFSLDVFILTLHIR